MTTTAIILARAGSKGLPNKNRAPVAGRPCAEWTIDAALAAHHVSTVALSTDDDRLKTIGRTLGVRVIDRPPDLAGDGATVDDAARHAVQSLDRDGAASDLLIILYANVPVRPAGLIDEAVALLDSTACDSVQSYCPVGKHHPWWTCRIDGADSATPAAVRPWAGETLYHNTFRRQDLPPAFIPDGGVIALTRRALFREVPGVEPGPHAFLGKDRRAIINPEGSVVDIDSRLDLLVAEAILHEAAPRTALVTPRP